MDRPVSASWRCCGGMSGVARIRGRQRVNRGPTPRSPGKCKVRAKTNTSPSGPFRTGATEGRCRKKSNLCRARCSGRVPGTPRARDALRTAFLEARAEVFARARQKKVDGIWILEGTGDAQHVTLDRAAHPTDQRVALDPLHQQLQRGIRDTAAELATASARLTNTLTWARLPAVAEDLRAAVDCEPAEVAGQLGRLYGLALRLGEFLETDNRVRGDPNAADDPLDHHIHGLLASLVQAEAPWLREFPTIARWDDQAGKALVRQSLFQPARELAEIARHERMIGERDAAELGLLSEAAHPTDFQGQKAGNRAAGHVRNLLIYSGGLLATLLAGAVSSDLAPGSALAHRIARSFNAAEAQIEVFVATMPGDLAQALRGLANAGRDLDGLAPVRRTAEPGDPEPPDDVEAQAREMILRGLAPPSGWRPFIRTLSFMRTALNSLHPLAGLTALQSLDLDGTQVSDVAPLAGLTALQTLDLRDTQVSDVAPLAGLTALETLSLIGTQVSDVAPLAALTALETLSLIGTPVSDVAPLAGLTALLTLDLDGTQVSDVAPLAGLTALQTLDLRDTQVSDVAPLAGLTALKSLYLNRTPVSDVAPLASLTALLRLQLSDGPVRGIALLDHLSDLEIIRGDGPPTRPPGRRRGAAMRPR
jgi:Leucine-rich repeat (LRR) protein